MRLYHGSPFKLDKLVPNKPRGIDEFTNLKAVFFTRKKKEAMLYSILRDKERKRRGWAIFENKAYILDKHRDTFTFNNVGYVYVVNSTDYVKDKNQYAITHEVLLSDIIKVTYDDIKNDIVFIDQKGRAELESRLS